MEIISVVEGRFGVYFNVGKKDFVSHPVAIDIAKNLGFYVGHIFSEGSDFSIYVDLDNETIRPKQEMSVVICEPEIKSEILKIIEMSKKSLRNI